MSWVIIDKQTNEAVLEVFEKEIMLRVDTKKYKVMTAMDYLTDLNLRR